MAIKLDNISLINLQNHAGSNVLTLNGSDTNVTFSGTVTATYFYGNGSNLTNVSASDNTKLPLAGGTLSGALTASGGISGLTLSNGISGTNFNISGVNQLTISDPGEGIVFGGGSAGNITLAVVDDSNDNIVRFTNAAYLQVGTSTVWHAGNDGSGSGLDADKVDNYHASQFFRRIAKATATVGPGWMTVAENVSGRRAGEIIVTDADSGDHAYIRIEWMRSYSDSNFTVLNCGGHSNRITGARVLYNTSDNTYGGKKLQVYVTTSSNYEVNIYEQGDIDDYSTHSVVTPVIQSTISGYAVHGKELINLDTFGFAAEEGILSGGDLKVLGSGNGIHVDSTGHASLRLDRASTSYDNNVLFMTGGGIKWRLWQDGTDDQLMIRDDANSYNSVVFNAGGASGYTTFNNPIRIGGAGSTNELDDYEEGSYNVQFRVGSNNYGSSNWVSGGGQVWTDNSQYVKVGRKVTLFFDLQYKGIPSAISTTSADLFLTNLPFTMAHGGGGNISFNWYNRNNSSANPQNFGGATRLTPDGTNQATQINLEHIEYSSYFNSWFPSSMNTNYLPTSPPGGNVYMYGQFTYFTDN